MSQGPSYVVGIDFGTTYSGIAWALEGSKNDIQVVSAWQDQRNRTYAKVPSVIDYDDKGRGVRWGYQVDLSTKGFRGIKLLLDDEQKFGYAHSLASGGLLEKHNKSAVQVTADYLERLVRHAKQIMLQDRLIPDQTDMNLRYILTVPAVWSDKAKDRTMSAAIQAGLPAEDISLISEPEAAALHALRKVLPGSFSGNDVFIVCDAGGGTVDLIAYRIKTLEPLELVEVTEGTGRVCGSLFLDERFENLVRGRMGAEKYDFLPDPCKDAVRSYWQDRVKPYYAGREEKSETSTGPSQSCSTLEDSDTVVGDDEYTEPDKFIPIANVQDDPTIPIIGGCFPLSANDLERIFEPIVRDVEELVAGQVATIAQRGFSTKAIILVGGFGSSPCLFNRLKKGHPTARILQPQDAWSAVVRGAVHRGLQGNQVESRIARRHYGATCGVPWLPKVHSTQNRYWDDVEELNLATEMRWFIKKASPMYEDQPIRIRLYFTARVDRAQTELIHHSSLYHCNAADAPKTRDDSYCVA
ncbi:actin-like ATPase domain-containing protein [Aspergillus steynii IBT 23096]|uniref:Actin-like ATPase domain-containing protein n=1 Tax=Aspergillus steynii IBT 23096 TaxID=1392250 RepID=A0A2I2GQK9_9EURO|nr:actin-like ATPase domain-containing protein [Aspergillus steynii IBT 23096]PLB55168.1 actin-like ATPase domain-containing protein [Aspergillus steynii IBT 23096]